MDLHVYIDFWISLKIIFFILFGEKKTGIFFESPKCLLVGGFAISDFVRKKTDPFWHIPFNAKSICFTSMTVFFTSMTVFAWLCFAEKTSSSFWIKFLAILRVVSQIMKKLWLQLFNNANGTYYSLLGHFPKISE